MMQKRKFNNSAFTLIEVLVAMLIFVMAAVAMLRLSEGAVRATREGKQISTATWLLQGVMVDLETKIETLGFDKGCEKKTDGKFEAPYEKFTYTTFCTEIDFRISETASKLIDEAQKDKPADDNQNKQNMITKMILQLASDYMSKAARELHAEVYWVDGNNKRQVSATTHFARYDMQLQLPNLAAMMGGG